MENKLTALAVKKATKPGYYADGGGLFLQIGRSGGKSWVYRFSLGRARDMGLGRADHVGLADARELARKARLSVLTGVDPIDARNAAKAANRINDKAAAMKAKAEVIEFAYCAKKYIEAHRAEWTSDSHAFQWTSTTRIPEFEGMPVGSINTDVVMRFLGPAWERKRVTADRVRGRIKNILDWAITKGYHAGPNPANWEPHLKILLSAAKKRSTRHPALKYGEIPEFLRELRAIEGTAARCLEFVTLTAARAGEAFGARPEEFDLDKGLWTIPAERMKNREEHRVPLSPRAVEIVRVQLALGAAYVFSGEAESEHLSDRFMLVLLQTLRPGKTVHGMRGAFRTWAEEEANFPHGVCEKALAHKVGSAVEQAYNFGDLLKKRALLMQAWADFVIPPVAVELRKVG